MLFYGQRHSAAWGKDAIEPVLVHLARERKVTSAQSLAPHTLARHPASVLQ